MNRERRALLIQQARYFAAGLVENSEPMLAGDFEDLTEEEHDLVHEEMQRIGKRIYPDGTHSE